MLEYFKGSMYEKYTTQQGTLISETIESIAALQSEVQASDSLQERIRAFALDNERLILVKKKIQELQDLLLEIPMKRKVSEIEKIKHAIKQLTKVMDVVRMGFQPDLSTTWWIILGVIAFLAIMSVTFYVIWLSKLKESKLLKTGDKAKREASKK